MAPIAYHVDEADRIVWIGPDWTTFAAANDAAELVPDVLLNRPLQAWISGLSIWNLYALLMHKVRRTGDPLTFAFRCDAPGLRRFLTMTLSPRPAGGLAFTSRLVRAEARVPVTLFDRRVPRSEQFVTICSWCKRAKMAGGAWVEVEEAVGTLRLFVDMRLPALTHGICRECSDQVMRLGDG
ncbi:MAG TPA: hypothetical protein VND92_08445 [Vicinamibacterales bacterium]|nr:hypothetical protein [Vicinamibacterales bacterium]